MFVDDGISIPASYTAYLAPLSSSKLYNETRVTKDEKEVETPYVVMFQAVNILSGDGGGIRGVCGPRVQECWEFEHPRRDAVLNEQGELPRKNFEGPERKHSPPDQVFPPLIATMRGPPSLLFISLMLGFCTASLVISKRFYMEISVSASIPTACRRSPRIC